MANTIPEHAGFFDQDTCDIAEFQTLIDATTDPFQVPHAASVEKNIPVYNMNDLRPALEDADKRKAIMAEWAQVLRNGAGIVALKNAYPDTQVLDDATRAFDRIIADERQGDGGGGDHFAASGANDRIWNALQKLCEAAPNVFVEYFANTSIAAICEAWLGPYYQMTAQVNLVHPGGAAQQAHRDYHLGFQTADVSAAFPAHVHDLSPSLTLQGAIAHCDMPLESGPTKLLPFSQKYRAGYVAWRRPDFRAIFEERHVQLPLSKGDTVFFNPALFHAAGANTSGDIHRFVNLLQVSSAFGRMMESVNRTKMCKLLYAPLLAAKRAGKLSASELHATIGAAAEGYSFPTNLDRDPPKNGLAPETQAAFIARALDEGMASDDVTSHLDAMVALQSA